MVATVNIRKHAVKSVIAAKGGNDQGITLVEVMVSLAITAIITIAMMVVLENVYRDRMQARVLTSRVIDTAIMKQALNATVTTAGALVTSPTPSAASAAPSPSSGNFFSQVWNMIFGCTIFSSQQIANNNQLLSGFFGNPTTGTSNTAGNANLQAVTLPSPYITVPTISTVQYDWISNNGGGQELCQGALQISGNVLRYTITSLNLVSGTSTCTPNGQSSDEADFLIGNGWSFQPLVTNTSCLGPAFPNQTADALIAVKAPMTGVSATSSTASTEVSVCIPNG